MTSPQRTERIGESPANCSFHLRTLAKYGFIEEAGSSKGRIRPWRTRSGSLLVEPETLLGDAKRAAVAMSDALRKALFRRIESWARERPDLPETWQNVGFEMEFVTTMSPDELKQVGQQIGEVLKPFQTAREESPEGRRVTIAAYGFPNPSD